MSFGKPAKLAPFRRIIDKLNRIINTRAVQDKAWNERCYYVMAWCYWLLWDLRSAPLHPKDGFHIIDPNSVQKYPQYGKHTGIKGAEIPTDWLNISLEALVDAEIILDNLRQGDRRRYRPSNLLKKYWEEVAVLEHRFSPHDDKDIIINIEATRRIRRLELVVRHLCKITGADFTLESQ